MTISQVITSVLSSANHNSTIIFLHGYIYIHGQTYSQQCVRPVISEGRSANYKPIRTSLNKLLFDIYAIVYIYTQLNDMQYTHTHVSS